MTCLIVKYILYINLWFESVSDNTTTRVQADLLLMFNTK